MTEIVGIGIAVAVITLCLAPMFALLRRLHWSHPRRYGVVLMVTFVAFLPLALALAIGMDLSPNAAGGIVGYAAVLWSVGFVWSDTDPPGDSQGDREPDARNAKEGKSRLRSIVGPLIVMYVWGAIGMAIMLGPDNWDWSLLTWVLWGATNALWMTSAVRSRLLPAREAQPDNEDL